MGSELNNIGCPYTDTAEAVQLASISARLRIVEEQANATDVEVSRISRIVNPDEWDGKINELKVSVTEETVQRTSADSALQQAIDQEITQRAGDIDNLSAQLVSEQTARENADTRALEAITAEGVERKKVDDKIIAETAARAEADTLLNQSVASLAAIVDTDRGVLTSEIEGVRTSAEESLVSETENRIVSDNAILKALDDEIIRAKAAENEEALKRAEEVEEEATIRSTEDTRILAELTKETNARTTLATKVDTEISNRDSADQNLQSQLNAEVTNRFAEDSRVLGEAKDYADEVASKVFKWKGAVETYTDLLALTDVEYGYVYRVREDDANYVYSPGDSGTSGEVWEKFSETIDLSPYAIKTEVTEALAVAKADRDEIKNTLIPNTKSQVEAKVSEEYERATSAETNLQSAINAESAARGNLGSSLRTAIQEGDSTLSKEFNTEIATLTNRIAAEERARADKDLSLDEEIDSIIKTTETRFNEIQADYGSKDASVKEELNAAIVGLESEWYEDKKNLNSSISENTKRIETEATQREQADDNLGIRIDAVEDRMTSLESRMSAVETKIAGIESQITTIISRIEALEAK